MYRCIHTPLRKQNPCKHTICPPEYLPQVPSLLVQTSDMGRFLVNLEGTSYYEQKHYMSSCSRVTGSIDIKTTTYDMSCVQREVVGYPEEFSKTCISLV